MPQEARSGRLGASADFSVLLRGWCHFWLSDRLMHSMFIIQFDLSPAELSKRNKPACQENLSGRC